MWRLVSAAGEDEATGGCTARGGLQEAYSHSSDEGLRQAEGKDEEPGWATGSQDGVPDGPEHQAHAAQGKQACRSNFKPHVASFLQPYV